MRQHWPRRGILQAATGVLGTLAIVKPALARSANRKGAGPIDTHYDPPGTGVVTGKGRGDFDFLAGQWRIRHRKRKSDSSDDWIEFESSAVVYRVLEGLGSIEELHNTNGTSMGMGVRTWLAEQGQWADHWTSAANGVVNPPQLGRFIDGEGVFITQETVGDVQWQYRGVWDRIGPQSCRWHQSSSSDGGKSWTWDWWMEWQRK